MKIGASELHFRTGTTSEANALIMQFHYSRRIPSNVQLVGTFHLQGGLFGDYGEAVAAICFSIPPTRWTEKVLELSRLVRIDSCRILLTRLISLSCKEVKKLTDLVVSFADPGQGHHGGVYQAAGWNYHGQRNASCDGLIINGSFVPGRSCNSIYGTRSAERLRIAKPNFVIQPHNSAGKHLYWKALSASGDSKAVRLQLNHNPYPKPNRAA